MSRETQTVDGARGVAYARGKFVGLDEPVIPIDDRAHQFGDGIYEVVRVYNGRPFLLDYHLERYARSAEAVRLPLDRPLHDLHSLIDEAIHRSLLVEAKVYFQLSRGIVERDHPFPNVSSHLTMTVRPLNDEAFHASRRYGQKVMLAEDIRWKYCHIKSLNLLPNILVKQRALDEGVQDALFVKQGIVTEGTSSNVAIVKNGEIYTHPADEQILHGVTRRAMIEIAKGAGIAVHETPFSVEDLYAADEAFTLSTITEIAPIIEVDRRLVGPSALEEKSILRYLQRTLRERISVETGLSVTS